LLRLSKKDMRRAEVPEKKPKQIVCLGGGKGGFGHDGEGMASGRSKISEKGSDR